MRKLVLTCLAAGAFIATAKAQTLFTYGNKPVTKEEFLRVYQKNSINKQADFSQAALKEYLDLYSLFRMKVNEAELQHIDTLSSIQAELDNYRKQLAKNYLTDEQVTNRLIQEAYDRMKSEVHVAHILIGSSQMGPSADTLVPYKKVDSIYNAVKKGADFSAMAKEFTDDRGTKEIGGDLGYITALQTVYPFENAVYNTPVGKVSAPFRSQFGYHIVKVLDKRAARGEVKVAQILIATPKYKGDEGMKLARKRLDSVQADIKKGIAFDKLVEKYSDDKFSIAEKGVLAPFGVGRMTPAYEEAAFSLKKPGDISAPVQTEYGFHILKLVEQIPMKPMDSLKAGLKKKVENDSRAQVARDIFFDKIKQKNGFKEYAANVDAVAEKMALIPDTGRTANTFSAADYRSMSKPVFALDGKEYTQVDFVSYMENITRGRLMGPKKAVVRDLYNMYVTTVLTDFEEHRLVDQYPEFKTLMAEYRDGIMLFELMDRNVWGKASRDTTGLKKFYESNKGKYNWEAGFKGSVYRFKNDGALDKGLKLLAKNNLKDEDIIKEMNSEKLPDQVTIQRGHYEFSKFKEVPRANILKGKASSPIKNNDGTYTVVKAEDVFDGPSPKSLEDARGYVVAEYQDYLEKQWNEQMRKKYPVKLNDKEFSSMVK